MSSSLTAEQQDILQAARTVSASLAMIGSVSVFIILGALKGRSSSQRRKEPLSFSDKIILCIALGDFISGISKIFGRAGPLDGEFRVACQLQAFGQSFGDLASIFWTLVLPFHLFLMLKRINSSTSSSPLNNNNTNEHLCNENIGSAINDNRIENPNNNLNNNLNDNHTDRFSRQDGTSAVLFGSLSKKDETTRKTFFSTWMSNNRQSFNNGSSNVHNETTTTTTLKSSYLQPSLQLLLYHIVIWSFSYLIALIPLFIPVRYKMMAYGDSILWCWITSEYFELQMIFFFAPLWISLVGVLGLTVFTFTKWAKNREHLLLSSGSERALKSSDNHPSSTTKLSSIGGFSNKDNKISVVSAMPGTLRDRDDAISWAVESKARHMSMTFPRDNPLANLSYYQQQYLRDSQIVAEEMSPGTSPRSSLYVDGTNNRRSSQNRLKQTSSSMNPYGGNKGSQRRDDDLESEANSIDTESDQNDVLDSLAQLRHTYYSILILTTAAFLLTWLPGTVNRLTLFANGNQPVFGLSLWQSIFSPGRGFTHFILFILVRNLLKYRGDKKKDSSSSGVDRVADKRWWWSSPNHNDGIVTESKLATPVRDNIKKALKDEKEDSGKVGDKTDDDIKVDDDVKDGGNNKFQKGAAALFNGIFGGLVTSPVTKNEEETVMNQVDDKGKRVVSIDSLSSSQRPVSDEGSRLMSVYSLLPKRIDAMNGPRPLPRPATPTLSIPKPPTETPSNLKGDAERSGASRSDLRYSIFKKLRGASKRQEVATSSIYSNDSAEDASDIGDKESRVSSSVASSKRDSRVRSVVSREDARNSTAFLSKLVEKKKWYEL